MAKMTGFREGFCAISADTRKFSLPHLSESPILVASITPPK